ncbi:hypothetical protein GQ457_01G051480 [Hibiscus cannabinus]
MTGNEGAVAISEIVKRSHALEDFRCSSTRVGTDGGLALAEALKTCTCLKKLDLRDNMFGVEAGVALSKAVSQFADLTEVYLTKGAASLAVCIASKQSLTKLNLAENELKDEGAILVAKSLSEGHGQLNEVDMSTNAIRRAGARHLATVVVKKPEFKLLNINGNFIPDEGIDKVKELFVSSPAVLGLLNKNDL